MNFRKNFILSVICMVFAICMFPMVAKAAPDLKNQSVQDLLRAKGMIRDIHSCEMCQVCNENEAGELRDGPYCNHADPWRPDTIHSSMRFIRTVYVWNEIESKYIRMDYFQCIFCGYEEGFNHSMYD